MTHVTKSLGQGSEFRVRNLKLTEMQNIAKNGQK